MKTNQPLTKKGWPKQEKLSTDVHTRVEAIVVTMGVASLRMVFSFLSHKVLISLLTFL
jgi:hypothetical protein